MAESVQLGDLVFVDVASMDPLVIEPEGEGVLERRVSEAVVETVKEDVWLPLVKLSVPDTAPLTVLLPLRALTVQLSVAERSTLTELLPLSVLVSVGDAESVSDDVTKFVIVSL